MLRPPVASCVCNGGWGSGGWGGLAGRGAVGCLLKLQYSHRLLDAGSFGRERVDDGSGGGGGSGGMTRQVSVSSGDRRR